MLERTIKKRFYLNYAFKSSRVTKV